MRSDSVNPISDLCDGWDAAAEAYDRWWVPQLERLTRRCVELAAPQLGDRVLDVATGTGVGAFAAAAAVGPSGAVTGVDLSERMVAVAAARARAAGAVNVHFVRADMQATGADDGGYDAVACAFGLMFAADHAAAIAELARVTAPGGRVAVCVWGRRTACGFAGLLPIVESHVEAEISPLFFSLGVPGALTAALCRAGFQDAVEELLPVTLAWPSAAEAFNAALVGGAVARAWNDFSPEARARVRAAYLGSLEPFRRGTRYEVPAEVVFATARR